MQNNLGINREQLKLIALISMLIDHSVQVFLEHNSLAYEIGRNIGRMAFPIFLVLFIFSFKHIVNHKKHILLLSISALASEFFYYSLNKPSHNIMFNWLLVYVLLLVIHYYNDAVMTISTCFIAASIGFLLKLDYGGIPAICVLLYVLLKDKLCKLDLYLIIVSFISLYTIQIYCLLVIPLLCVYNDHDKTKLTSKYLYYFIYPFHLAVLWAINNYLLQ